MALRLLVYLHPNTHKQIIELGPVTFCTLAPILVFLTKRSKQGNFCAQIAQLSVGACGTSGSVKKHAGVSGITVF